jgi:uncharacterized membrane protein
MEESAINKTVKSVVDRINSENANVGEKERWLSALGGGALLLYGLKKRSWPGLALALLGGAFVYRGATGRCPVYQALEIDTAKKEGAVPSERETGAAPEDGWVRAEKSIVVQKDPEAVYHFFQNVENLPRVLGHLESVRGKNHHHSHWIAKATKGIELDWEAEAINEKMNEEITWRAIEEGILTTSFQSVWKKARTARERWSGCHSNIIRIKASWGPPSADFSEEIRNGF